MLYENKSTNSKASRAAAAENLVSANSCEPWDDCSVARFCSRFFRFEQKTPEAPRGDTRVPFTSKKRCSLCTLLAQIFSSCVEHSIPLISGRVDLQSMGTGQALLEKFQCAGAEVVVVLDRKSFDAL
jgi:hypothetical protein